MTDTQTRGVPSTKRPRDRSPSFPFIPLGTAIDRLVALEKHFGRHATPADKAGLAWGYKEKSSQADQTLGALRSFGLIDYKGTGPKREIEISADGRTYLRAEQESTKRSVIKALATRPRIIRKLWFTWGADRPVDAVALEKLKFEYKFSDSGARAFLSVYDATVAFAKLSTDDKVTDADSSSEDDESPPLPTVEVGDLVQVEVNGAFQLEKPARVRAIQPHEGQDWVFIEGSETGIPMNQVIIGQKESAGAGKSPVTPPTLPEKPSARLPPGEREWLRGPLSRDTSYRLIVAGDLGPKEIGKLIKLLKAQQAVLSDEEDDDEEAAN